MSCHMKYKNRRKVWWKPGEVTHSPRKGRPRDLEDIMSRKYRNSS